ncbi:hypothetical protein DFA_00642 [Cavenderia fasciculata]|uniref:Legume lectin domain-containing protein n=1 Tax=Cavenderia fasciculata TaxID=261658 RepID=F4PSY8_CACFS|nr:uncharacterized protein DFA_00642 [Cavenderia fasciculata]EGG20777.1 hypothetical protein DFA_00642 [Cavenderia fasciculata]|eukprot:XP_004358627.1 hypothetical protein DFA_00642 [Cavenderia fasciculata]
MEKDNQRLNQAFFAVLCNIYTRNAIFSYLPLFVLTTKSVNMISAHFETVDEAKEVKMRSVRGRYDTVPSFRLTSQEQLQTGTIWSKKKIRVLSGFTATFRFQVTPVNGASGDGLAFVIQNAPNGNRTYHKSDGSSMGYAGIPNSVAIEFDTYEYGGDPNNNHISIQTKGKQPNDWRHQYSIGWGTPSTRIDNGAIHESIITYDTKSHPQPTITVSMNGEIIINNLKYDLGSIGLDNGTAFIGFSAATGYSAQFHRVLSCEILN